MLNSFSPLHFFHLSFATRCAGFFFMLLLLFSTVKVRGHFVVFLNLFFPKTDLLKRGMGGRHPIRNPLILGFLVKDDILQFFARWGILHSVQWVACLFVTPGEQVTREALDDPQEELVTELRARIKELQQHQERLLREGETLQVSPGWQISWKYSDWVINYEACSKSRVP